jgi:hypothetical protein
MMGLAAVAVCFLMPREIGKEDEPLTNVRLKMPDVEGAMLRMRQPRRPRPVAGQPAAAVQQPMPEVPSAMGAPQPVLTEEPSPSLALPSNF